MEETYKVYFEDTDSPVKAHYIRRVKATGIIPAIQKAIDVDELHWEVTKVEKEN